MDLYFTECVKREHSVLFQLRFLYRALYFFSVVTDANILSGTDGSSPPCTVCQLCTGLNCRATSTSRGLFSQLQLRSEADDLLRWGWSVCVCMKLKLTLHQRHRKFSQSPMKVCVMPSEISAQQLFFMAADAFTCVRFQYEHFFKASCAQTQIFGPTETTTTAAVSRTDET